MSTGGETLEETTTLRNGSKRLKIKVSQSSEWIWNLTLLDGNKVVDTFHAKRMPFLNCSSVKTWLNNNDAVCFCTEAEKVIVKMNEKLGHHH